MYRRLRLSIPGLGFILIHLICFTAIWTGLGLKSLILCAVMFFVRKFGITGGFHRYFSHRSYKTSRVFQFILAFIGGAAAQKGALWWAAHHRHHHKHSDTDETCTPPSWRASIGRIWAGCFPTNTRPTTRTP